MTELIHHELSFEIIGCIFDVHNAIGPRLREECYQKAMEQRLCEKGMPFVAKPTTRRDLIYRGENIDSLEPDLVVADKIIPELKHQVEGFVPENEAQVLNYLKLWNMELGLLVNFALDKAVFERIPRQPRRRSWTRVTSGTSLQRVRPEKQPFDLLSPLGREQFGKRY